LIIPGGFLIFTKLQFDDEFIDWLKTVKQPIKYRLLAGSLLLGSGRILEKPKPPPPISTDTKPRITALMAVKYRIVDDNA
jgi:hypothetical protein